MSTDRGRNQSWAGIEDLPPDIKGRPIHAPSARGDNEPLCEQGGTKLPDEVLIAGRKRLDAVTCQDCIEWMHA